MGRFTRCTCVCVGYVFILSAVSSQTRAWSIYILARFTHHGLVCLGHASRLSDSVSRTRITLTLTARLTPRVNRTDVTRTLVILLVTPYALLSLRNYGAVQRCGQRVTDTRNNGKREKRNING